MRSFISVLPASHAWPSSHCASTELQGGGVRLAVAGLGAGALMVLMVCVEPVPANRITAWQAPFDGEALCQGYKIHHGAGFTGAKILPTLAIRKDGEGWFRILAEWAAILPNLGSAGEVAKPPSIRD
jgi:hypothetical protein